MGTICQKHTLNGDCVKSTPLSLIRTIAQNHTNSGGLPDSISKMYTFTGNSKIEFLKIVLLVETVFH